MRRGVERSDLLGEYTNSLGNDKVVTMSEVTKISIPEIDIEACHPLHSHEQLVSWHALYRQNEERRECGFAGTIACSKPLSERLIRLGHERDRLNGLHVPRRIAAVEFKKRHVSAYIYISMEMTK